jgi:sulfur-carrier protein adenylyltransferase/sulfurtransferase
LPSEEACEVAPAFRGLAAWREECFDPVVATFPEELARAMAEIPVVTPQELSQQLGVAARPLGTPSPPTPSLAGTPTLLDVREGFEVAGGTLPGAIHVPHTRVEDDVERLLPNKARPVVVFCSGSRRAALVGVQLRELGYDHVSRLAPGFDVWRRLGLPVERRGPSREGSGTPSASDPSVRYARHLALPSVGAAGQEKLRAARVLVVGAGGLGSPAALYLAAAGVGTLGVVDDDVVELSNLQRQVLHTTARVGSPKVESAEVTLTALNPDVTVVPLHTRATRENAKDLVKTYDVVLDGTDNLATRYALNEACFATERPLVFGSVHRFDGQVAVFGHAARHGVHARWSGPCYRCLHPHEPRDGEPALAADCTTDGVLGVLPGLVGTLQALETLKLLLGLGRSLTTSVLHVDALTLRFTELMLRADPGCPVCGSKVRVGG